MRTIAHGRDGGKRLCSVPVESDEIRRVAGRLGAQTEALAALGAALRLRSGGQEAPPIVQRCLDDVVRALGLERALAEATPADLGAAVAPIRALLIQALDLVNDPARAPGWSYADVELLQTLGQASADLARLVRDELAPRLEGLGEALDRPGAQFLDVGVGVGALSIAMCRAFPGLRAVGIDPWELALELAERNVAEAGLRDRIELRRQPVEELDDPSRFDLVYLAGSFLGPASVGPACERAFAALKPGGYALFSLFSGSDDLASALARLRTARSGGAIMDAREAEERLAAAGFVQVETVTADHELPSQVVVGRRPA